MVKKAAKSRKAAGDLGMGEDPKGVKRRQKAG